MDRGIRNEDAALDLTKFFSLLGIDKEDITKIKDEIQNVQCSENVAQELCRILKICDSNKSYSHCLLYLPTVLKCHELGKAEISKLVNVFPVFLLHRLLDISSSAEFDEGFELVINVLSVLLSNGSETDISKFTDIIQPLYYAIVSKKIWNSVSLENACLAFIALIGENSTSKQLINLLNLIANELKMNSDQLPSVNILGCIVNIIEKLMNSSDFISCKNISKGSWSADLRIVIRRLLQTPHINFDYHLKSFLIVSLIVYIVDIEWFEDDPDFMLLLASLALVQFHSLLTDPKYANNLENLTACVRLMESFFEFGESTTVLNDDQATILSLQCHKSLIFICDYLIQSYKSPTEIYLDLESQMILTELLCCFLSYGGLEALSKKQHNDLISYLFEIARKAMLNKRFNLFGKILLNLPRFQKLPKSCLGIITDALDLHRSLSGKGTDDLPLKVLCFIKNMKSRNDWYTIKDLERAKNLTQRFDLKDLTMIFDALK